MYCCVPEWLHIARHCSLLSFPGLFAFVTLHPHALFLRVPYTRMEFGSLVSLWVEFDYQARAYWVHTYYIGDHDFSVWNRVPYTRVRSTRMKKPSSELSGWFLWVLSFCYVCLPRSGIMCEAHKLNIGPLTLCDVRCRTFKHALTTARAHSFPDTTMVPKSSAVCTRSFA